MYSPLKTVLKELMHSPATTFELRAKGVCSPAPAIHRLKKQGYPIKTTLLSCYDDAGVLHHRVAQYSLEHTVQYYPVFTANQHGCLYPNGQRRLF